MNGSSVEHERRYRRLLWAYPGSYRRRHGAEIVTTLLEMAESGHGRLTVMQTVHLVACGIRQRFRLPAGRPLAAIAAVLAAIAMGALGSAGGTWLGWRTAASVPSNEAMRGLTADLVGDQAGGSRADVDIFPWRTAMNGPVVATRATVHSAYSAERVRTALTTAGWRITTFTETTSATPVDLAADPSVTVPTRSVMFKATKDGLSLTGYSWSVNGDARHAIDQQTDERLDVWANENASVRPLTIAGWLLGAVAGWLVAAALAYRVQGSGRARQSVVAVLVAAAFAAAVIPAFDLYRNLYQVLIYDSGAPNPYIIYGPSEQLPAGLVALCAGTGLLALTIALLIARRGAPTVSRPGRFARSG
jgi:hypothetical protein